jgi:hypothetical protein
MSKCGALWYPGMPASLSSFHDRTTGQSLLNPALALPLPLPALAVDTFLAAEGLGATAGAVPLTTFFMP